MSEGSSEATRTCPWCGATAGSTATICPSCGAALAERDSLGGLVIPGVTSVDPALQAYDARPVRLPGSSPSQGLAGGTIAAAALGGPVGVAALGGLAAVAAVEYLRVGGRGQDRRPLDELGTPGDAALQMVRELDKERPNSGVAGSGSGAPASDSGGPTSDSGGPGSDPDASG